MSFTPGAGLRRSWPISLLVVVVSGVVASSAIAGRASPNTPHDETVTRPHTDSAGAVTIADASRQFITVDVVGGSSTDAAISAPAHAEFREGALAKVGAPLSGRVVAVHVRTGDRVAAGDRLVTLDAPDAAEARGAVKSVTATLREARIAAEREQRMFERGIGVEREKIAADTRVAELESDLARATSRVEFIGAGTGGTVVLRAPIAGTVVNRLAVEGMTVEPAGELIEIGDASALWIVADVFERDVPLLREGAPARVAFASARGLLNGRVSSIGAVVAEGVRTAPVRITLTSPAGPLRPGMYGRAEIAVASHGSISLPTEAVLIKGKETVVYVEQNPTTFVRRAVVIGQPNAGRVQVISGLHAGERVVIRGALLLDGAADQLL